MGFPERKPCIKGPGSSTKANDMAAAKDTLTRLSPWDQASMRGYMRVTLCFPFENQFIADATEHIKASLDRLALQRPDFAGRLETHKGGIVHLHTKAAGSEEIPTIPFFVDDISETFPYKSYAELKDAEFPPGAFVHPQFGHPCDMAENKPGVPVALVKAFVIPGGMLLGIYFNHAIADGDCLRIFLDSFSGQTCGKVIDGASVKHLEIPNSHSGATQEELLQRIPEYVVMDSLTGPTMPRMRTGGVPMDDIVKIGKIFVFNNKKLKELRASLAAAAGDTKNNGTGAKSIGGGESNISISNNSRGGEENHTQDSGRKNSDSSGESDIHTKPTMFSNYTCMAALAWTHLTRARQLDENQYLPREPGVDDLALLQTMVNWKRRAFQAANENYFGNATAVATTRLPTDGLLAEAVHDTTRLSELVARIEQTINGVDDNYVRDRTEFFNTVSDPRRVGLRFDPRTPQDLGFNTWRHFGADTQWAIPGVGEGGARGGRPTSPEVMRRLQDAWNMSGALILPSKASSEVHELLVTLPKTSMDVLCQDPEWMKWVDHVIG